MKEAISRHLESIWTLFPGCLPSFAELSSNPLQYELERLNKETDKRRKLRPSGETKGSLLPSSRVAQRKINDRGRPKESSSPVQDQASMALEEITSPIQNQVFTTLESNSTPDKRSKFRPSEETKRILQPSSRLSLWKINDWRKPENLPVELKIKPRWPLKKFPAQFKIKPRRPLG